MARCPENSMLRDANGAKWLFHDNLASLTLAISVHAVPWLHSVLTLCRNGPCVFALGALYIIMCDKDPSEF